MGGAERERLEDQQIQGAPKGVGLGSGGHGNRLLVDSEKKLAALFSKSRGVAGASA
jgi:hypothetical protein